jgi:hypothetical protein
MPGNMLCQETVEARAVMHIVYNGFLVRTPLLEKILIYNRQVPL